MGQWSDMVKPIVAKCEVGANFGERVVFNRDGAKALGELLKRMAATLDEAAEQPTGFVLRDWVSAP